MSIMPVTTKFILTVGLIVFSTAAGHFMRTRRLLGEQVAKYLMTAVAVLGYPLVGLLSIWKIDPRGTDIWLPVLGAAQIGLMAAAGLAVGRLLSRDRSETGLFAIASAIGNTGFTMGGFIIYLLYGEDGLGLVSIYGIMWMPMIVTVLYPIARSFSDRSPAGPLGRLIVRSIFDWRSVGLLGAAAGIVLSVSGPPRPQAISDYRIVDILMFSMAALAYFSIGLRLHLSYLRRLGRTIVSLAAVRFGLGALMGLALVSFTLLTPWPLAGLKRNVVLIEAFVPTAVTCVAVANMFALKPRHASMLFVANTAMYLALVLPCVLLIFGAGV